MDIGHRLLLSIIIAQPIDCPWLLLQVFGLSEFDVIVMYVLYVLGGSEGYDSNMIAASSRMASIGDKMATRDFSWNLIVWSSFGYSITDDNGFFSFVSTGDVRKIFDRLNVIGGFASGNGLCRTPSVIKYDPYSATFDVTLTDYGDGSERSAADPCAASLNPVGFGYDGQYDGDNVAFQLDMRSFTTAVAVNNGIIGLSDLNGVMTTTSVVAVPRADGSILSGTRRGYFVSYYSGRNQSLQYFNMF